MTVNGTQRVLDFSIKQKATEYKSKIDVKCYKTMTPKISSNQIFVDQPHAEPRVMCNNDDMQREFGSYNRVVLSISVSNDREEAYLAFNHTVEEYSFALT